MDVQFFEDAGTFLREAGALLTADPLRYSVIAGTAERANASRRPADVPWWFAVVRDDRRIQGVAMRTHPQPPHAGFAAAMPPDAVEALAAALAERGEQVSAWNGDLDAAQALCEAVADGRPVEVAMHTRLFEAGEVAWPRRPDGILRVAGADDEELVTAWLRDFHHDADVQAGRTPDPAAVPTAPPPGLESGEFWIWEVGGRPVHMTKVRPPAFGTRLIGPVYTPARHRGRGYAAWTVAALTGRVLDAGRRPCLYTDQANPVSNRLYERLGYRPVRDEGNVVVRR